MEGKMLRIRLYHMWKFNVGYKELILFSCIEKEHSWSLPYLCLKRLQIGQVVK
jgi:hypothetical protein